MFSLRLENGPISGIHSIVFVPVWVRSYEPVSISQALEGTSCDLPEARFILRRPVESGD